MTGENKKLVLEARAISKSYGQRSVLNDVTLELQPGEIFGFLGSNGAGKTTLMRLLMGIEKADQGTMLFFGEKRKWSLKTRLGIVPQDDFLYREFSVRDNLYFFGGLMNLHGKNLDDRVHKLLEWLSLSSLSTMRVEQLSGGYRKLVNIACSIVHDPDIVFLDEPTVALDVVMRRAVWRRLKELRALGKTLCLTTHYLDEARLLCDRIAVLHKGRILVNDTPANLIENFGGKDIVRLRLSAGASEAASVLATQFPDFAIEAQGDDIVLVVPKRGSFSAMANVSALLAEHHWSVVSSTVKEPGIDEVFLSLTGEKAE